MNKSQTIFGFPVVVSEELETPAEPFKLGRLGDMIPAAGPVANKQALDELFEEYAKDRGVTLTQIQKDASKSIGALIDSNQQVRRLFTACGSGATTLLSLLESFYKTQHADNSVLDDVPANGYLLKDITKP